MSLAAGTRLGPYEVLAKLGEGGMGEVYKARDTRLDRTVAVKILPAELSADPERRVRFEREARAVAALSHPHICTLYDTGECVLSNPESQVPNPVPVHYLVMEFLAGETLAARLAKGRLPVDQALSVATEIADALAAAHRQGIIHRDLKPGNVMLTKSGPKLLDFGLAKLTGHGERPTVAPVVPGAEAPGLHGDTAPTRSAPLTAEGTIVGTLQYMAPEQVEGKPADARTDLWALGAILYEMITGARAFRGESAASLIGNIMNAEPAALAAEQPLTPSGVDRLVRRCLAKALDDRPDTAHDVADELRWMRETSGVGRLTDVQSGHRSVRRTVLVVVGMVVAAMAGAGVMRLLRQPPPPASLAYLSLDVRPAEALHAGGARLVPTPGGSLTALTWTPDGQALVYVGRRGGVQQLYVRRLDAAEARPLQGTEGAQVPAVSADGQWVAFWAGGAIKKVPFDGGLATDLASGVESPPWGLVWDAGGRLFLSESGAWSSAGSRIWQIPVNGLPAPVTTVSEAEWSHGFPWPLPGGRVLLYTVRKRGWTWGDEEIVAHTLATGARKVVLREGGDARYVPTGHLVFLRRGKLFAVPFDAERLEVEGDAVPVLDAVAQALTEDDDRDCTGAGQFAVAPTGTLAWVRGPLQPFPEHVLVSVDRRGRASSLATPPRSYRPVVRVAPGGRQVAVTVRSLTEVGLWLYDLARGTPTPLALGGEVDWPIWTPDGQRVVFGWLKDGRYSLAWQRADGATPPERLTRGGVVPSSWTPDGRQLAVATVSEGELSVVTVERGQARVQPLFVSPDKAYWPEFSPDGHWLAFGSAVSGRNEIYVQPYPGPGPRTPVSIEGGQQPAWNPTGGRELFYLTTLPDGAGRLRMMVVAFEAGSPPRIGRPQELFSFDPRDLRFPCGDSFRCYDVAPDGQRFYVVQTPTPPPPPVVTHIELILNWFKELTVKVPAGGATK